MINVNSHTVSSNAASVVGAVQLVLQNNVGTVRVKVSLAFTVDHRTVPFRVIV